MAPGFGFGGVRDSGASGFSGVDLGDLFSQVFPGSGASQTTWSFSTGDFAEPNRPRSRRRRPQSAENLRSDVSVKAADGSTLVKRGNHIYSDVRVGIDQAVMGAVVSVPTLDGAASVKIPPGTSSGAKLRLKGKGTRGSHGKLGDHYVTVQIDVPKRVDEEAIRLLVEFMQRTKRST